MSENHFTPTKEYLHQVFTYKNGHLHWKIARQKINVGNKAGNIDPKHPYVRITLNGKRYQEHRLVFLMFNGFLPNQIDHINLIKHDNRIKNLRESTISQNAWNTKPKNQHKNVGWHKYIKKWQVQLKVNGKCHHFGYYEDVELADLVAHEARSLYHGKFARHS